MVEGQGAPHVGLLKEVRILKCMTDQELEQLIKGGTSAAYEAETNIIIEGELSWGLYLIIEGMIGIYKANKMTGDSYDVGQLTSGSFFGEMSLIDDNPRSATIRALTNCRVFYISKDVFTHFLDQSQDLKLRFYTSCVKNMVERLRELDDNYVISQYQLWKTALEKEAA